MIYFDYNATSPYSKSVKNFIQHEMINSWANPSSEHAEGASLGDEIKLLRGQIADQLGCSSKQLIFTSGATESINTVLSVDNLKEFQVKRIITSPMEHHATLDRVKYLEKNGFEIRFLRNDENGILDLDHLRELLSENVPTIVSLLYANNETGVINPIKEIGEIVKSFQQYIHVDGVQALGKVKFNLDDLQIDFMSFSGHKIGSFKGIGLLYCENIKNLKPLLHGGGQERGYRPGTSNYPGIRSFALALTDSLSWDLGQVLAIRNDLEKQLKEEFGAQINCERSPRLVNTVNVYFEGKNAREILNRLSRENILVSTGSACSSGSFEPSHVLKSLKNDKIFAGACLRISVGSYTTKEEVSFFIEKLKLLFAKKEEHPDIAKLPLVDQLNHASELYPS